MRGKLISRLFLLLITYAPSAWALEPLVDSNWLAGHVEDPGLVVLDVQSAEYYQRVHLQGAVSAPFDRWRVRNAKGVPGMLPPVEQLAAMLGRLGIRPSDSLVITVTGFGAGEMAAAARVYWTLKVLGHEQVGILNGGLSTFAADKARQAWLTAEPFSRSPVEYVAKPDLSLLAGVDDVLSGLDQGVQMIDARSAAEYLGIHVGGEGERAGALPKALNLPFDWLTENGSAELLPAQRLRTLMGAVGVADQAPQVHYCHSGNRAALNWFVSWAMLGNRQARLYDGSMLEWAPRKDLPMERRVNF